MDTLLNTIFTNEQAEWDNMQTSNPSIDMSDWPITPALTPTFTSGSQYLVTSTISQAGYFEIQFMLANTFWGCSFNYGQSSCGIQIRQGISHLVDKAKFATSDAFCNTQCSAIDAPLPTSNIGNLPEANPCAWDASFPETGCTVGEAPGRAYHLLAATGNGPYAWLPAPGSSDFCAAATHFINAGIATGKDPNTCVLTGIVPGATSGGVPNFFIRNDNPPRLDLGNGLAAEICDLFTGTLSAPCTYLTTTPGNILAFPGFQTSDDSVNNSWHFYTAGYGATVGQLQYDSGLYYTYNSNFVSGIPAIKNPIGHCASTSVPSFSAPDYMYICIPNFDSLGKSLEFAACLHASGEPVPGSTSNNPTGPNNAQCPGAPSGSLSAISYAVQAEDLFGQYALTLPVFQQSLQNVYLNNGWQRVINGQGTGIPNYYTWLNAWNQNPVQPGTLRQGFKQSTSSASPFIASTIWDAYVVGNIYDTLGATNPVSNDLFNWMIVNEQQLATSQLTYTPPSGTSTTFRFTLRSDMFFQDGSKVTSFDVAGSYLALKGSGAFAGGGASPMTGFTILGPSQFDINVMASGPTTLIGIEALYVLPYKYWANIGPSAFSTAITSCTGVGANCYPAQYTLGSDGATPTCVTGGKLSCSFAASNFNWDPNKITANYDPIQNHILIGSGPWECGAPISIGAGCTVNGLQNPTIGNSYTLTRYGKGLSPGSSTTQIYFRSSGNLALWIWSQNNGDLTHDFLNFSVVAACYGKPADPLGSTKSPCDHFQEGIGANGGPVVVGLGQVSIVNRFVGLNWVAPFSWTSNPPTAIGILPPVLHEGSNVLNPSSVAPCTSA
jgi:hypothetical protein